jgi:crossover junction endonuclease MUS81
MLLIKVDFREKDLIALMQLKLINGGENNNIKFKVDNLKIGDVAFIEIDKNENEIGDELLLFERKSLNDLASSIKDGRYAEQSFRLDGYQAVPNHNIIYLIEGDISRYRENQFSRINKNTLLSSMFSILYYKGFSVIRTMNVIETSELIWSWADKLERELDGKKIKSGSKKTAYYTTLVSNSDGTAEENMQNVQNVQELQIQIHMPTVSEENEKNVVKLYDYCNVLKVKKEKNANVTPENIGVIMLSTIPGISSKTASAIMNEFKTMAQLIKSFEQNPHCLNHICIENDGGKSRKITSTCIENIRKYVLHM